MSIAPKLEFESLRHARPRIRRTASLVALYSVACLICVSIGHTASNWIIWERGDQIVQLAKQDDASAASNDHPFSTTPSEIAAKLHALRLRYNDDEPDDPPVTVFSEEEIDNLSKAVATGLRRAAPSQDIIFHIIGSRRISRGMFARRNRVSAGRIFYQDGNLNIIFGQVQTPKRSKRIYGQVEEDYYPRNYGSRTKAAKHDVVLLTDSGIRLHQSGTGVRNDWLVIGPNAAVASGRSSTAADSVAAAPQPESATPVKTGEAPAIPVSPAADTAAIEVSQHERAAAPTVSSTSDVEERLADLKRLRELDLISEDAYQAKMKEILQDL